MMQKATKRVLAVLLTCVCLSGGLALFLNRRQGSATTVANAPSQTSKLEIKTPAEVVQSNQVVRAKQKKLVRTMRFLELLRQFFPKDQQSGLDKVIAEGVDKQPDGFTKLSFKYMELYGYLKNEGKLGAYYEALKKEHWKNPNDINVLRILAAVSSIPSTGLRNEYETWLAELATVDTHEDVLFPYTELLLSKGDAAKAYEQVCRVVSEHPEEASEMLTNSLRVFAEYKDASEWAKIVELLKAETSLDPFHANCCGDVLYKSGDLENAEYFFRTCSTTTDSKYYRELADVKICMIMAKEGKPSNEMVSRLKELATDSSTPAVRKDARRALNLLNIEFEHQPRTN